MTSGVERGWNRVRRHRRLPSLLYCGKEVFIMSKEYENYEWQQMLEQYRQETDEIRALSRRILSQTPQEIELSQASRFFKWLFDMPVRTFTTQWKPAFSYIIREVVQSENTPILDIAEWKDSRRLITLSGLNAKREEIVPIMEIYVPKDTVDSLDTTVVMCNDFAIVHFPYSRFAQSEQIYLVSDVVVPALRAIDRCLK